MDHQRGRSPSAGHTIKHHSPSPSPHAPFTHNAPALGFDTSLDPATTLTAPTNNFGDAQFLSATSQSQPFAQQPAFTPGFLQADPALSQHSTPHFAPQGNSLTPDTLDLSTQNNSDFNNLFTDNDLVLDQNQAIDTSFLNTTLDPQLLDSQPQNQSINPSEFMSQMATAPAHSPTPPHLLPNMNNQQSPSPHASPNLNQGQFHSPSHSRHASLDPSAAYGPVQGGEWANMNMGQFRGHRRTPSETYSDISSAHASPYLGHQDSFEDTHASPLLNAQADPQLFHDPVMQFNQFNLNDSNAHISPGHSPHISPRLMPQQQHALPQFQPNTFGIGADMNNQFAQPGMGFGQQPVEPFPALNQGGPDFGQADQMSPPEINIDFAPPSRQASFEPPKPEHQADALSPPDRCT